MGFKFNKRVWDGYEIFFKTRGGFGYYPIPPRPAPFTYKIPNGVPSIWFISFFNYTSTFRATHNQITGKKIKIKHKDNILSNELKQNFIEMTKARIGVKTKQQKHPNWKMKQDQEQRKPKLLFKPRTWGSRIKNAQVHPRTITIPSDSQLMIQSQKLNEITSPLSKSSVLLLLLHIFAKDS